MNINDVCQVAYVTRYEGYLEDYWNNISINNISHEIRYYENGEMGHPITMYKVMM